MELETGKTDENGRAIHEECYDRQLKNTTSSLAHKTSVKKYEAKRP
jgi:hypothetical protein